MKFPCVLLSIRQYRNEENLTVSESKLPPSVQFFDCLSEIKGMKSRRFSMRKIWTYLKSEGKYIGDYTHFCRLYKTEFKKDGIIQTSLGDSYKKIEDNQKQASSSAKDQDEPLMFMADIGKQTKNNKGV